MSNLVGWVVQAPSMPLVTVSPPMPRLVQVDASQAPASSIPGAIPDPGPEQARIAIAVGLADGMTAGGQRDGFLVVHRHAREGLANGLLPSSADLACRRRLPDSRRSGPSALRRAGFSSDCALLSSVIAVLGPAIPSPSPSRCPFQGAKCLGGRSRTRRSSGPWTHRRWCRQG